MRDTILSPLHWLRGHTTRDDQGWAGLGWAGLGWEAPGRPNDIVAHAQLGSLSSERAAPASANGRRRGHASVGLRGSEREGERASGRPCCGHCWLCPFGGEREQLSAPGRMAWHSAAAMDEGTPTFASPGGQGRNPRPRHPACHAQPDQTTCSRADTVKRYTSFDSADPATAGGSPLASTTLMSSPLVSGNPPQASRARRPPSTPKSPSPSEWELGRILWVLMAQHPNTRAGHGATP